ncbi:MAG: hypothetical protein ACLPQS_05390 [Acidimicrobiales bacterium]
MTIISSHPLPVQEMTSRQAHPSASSYIQIVAKADPVRTQQGPSGWSELRKAGDGAAIIDARPIFASLRLKRHSEMTR